MKQLLYTLLAIAAMLSACSKDTTELVPGNGDGVIRLSAAVTASGEVEDQTDSQNQTDPKGQTRAPHKDETGSKAVLSDIHFLRKDGTSLPTDFSGVTALRANRDATGAITFTSGTNVPTYDKATDKNAYFMAYWPTSKTNATTVALTSGVKVAWDIDGTTDVLVSTPYDAGKYSAPKFGTMTFKHALAQLEVIVRAAPTTTTSLEAVQAMWGKIYYICIENAPALVTYTFADNKVTYSTPMRRLLYQTDYKTAYINLPIPSSANTATTAAGMHSPVKGEPIRLLLQTEKFPDGIEVPVQLKNTAGANCDFEAGKRYVVTLTLGADDKQVYVSSTVAEWNTGRTGQGSSTWAAPAVGDFYYTDGTWSKTKNATKTVDGVIFWIDPEDPAHFKVITPDNVLPTEGTTNAEGKVQWSSSEFDIVSFYPGIVAEYDYSATDAADNINAVGRLSGVANRAWFGQWLANPAANTKGKTIADFPAFKACDDHGPGWYLPSVNEWQHFYSAYYNVAPVNWGYGEPTFAWNNNYVVWWTSLIGELAAGTFSELYWASTLRENNVVWAQGFFVSGHGETSNDNLHDAYCFVRCIKEINPVGQAAAPKVEDYYYSDGTWSRALIPGKTPEGVIYWVDAANPEHFKVVDMAGPPAAWDGSGNVAGKLPWSSNGNTLIGTNNNTDGKANTLKITQSPSGLFDKAARWCYTRNRGLLSTDASAVTVNTPGYDWYLPARNEVQHLFCAYWGVAPRSDWGGYASFTASKGYPDAWNARFATPFLDDYTWSSSESSETAARLVRLSDGHSAVTGKSGHCLVRCVREVGAPAVPVAPPKVEDYFYSDGTFSREFDPHKSLEGVIFWVDEHNPKHIKVVGLTEPPANWDGLGNEAGNLEWSTENISTGATNAVYGKTNTLTLMQLASADKYKAAKWCYTRNAGAKVPALSSVTTEDANYKWYLPAKNEMQYLFCAYWGVAPKTWSSLANFSAASGYPAAWNERFATQTSFAADAYWLSSEINSGYNCFISFNSGNAYDNGNKASKYGVRCIREITLP